MYNLTQQHIESEYIWFPEESNLEQRKGFVTLCVYIWVGGGVLYVTDEHSTKPDAYELDEADKMSTLQWGHMIRMLCI
jgi:hypothetical protein